MRLAIAALTCALLIAEITLTRLFSVTMMYHFAFLVLSLTLLGLGTGGVFNYLWGFLRRNTEAWLGWLPLATALAFPLCVGLILRIRFSPLQLSGSGVLALVAIVLICCLPFFLCGLFLSLIYLSRKEQIPQLYAFDLLGGATGCAVAVFLLDRIGAMAIPWVVSCLMVLSALAQPGALLHRRRIIAAGFIILLVIAGWSTQWLHLRYVKGNLEPPSEFEKWNAFSRVAVQDAGDRKFVRIDADAATEILGVSWIQREGHTLLNQISGLVYRLRPKSHALVIGPGGGRDVVSARIAGSSVIGVEINPIIVRNLMLERYYDFSGRIYTSPGVEIITSNARNYIEGTRDHFDVIQANAIDTWAATSGGGLTLSESYLYTTEAFQTYLDRLNPTGILTLGRWEFDTPQQMIRVMALALEAMKREHIPEPAGRVFVLSDPSYHQGGGTPAVIFIKKEPFTSGEASLLRECAVERGFQVLYDPGSSGANAFSALARAKDPDRFFDSYPFNIRPPTDDRPFFFFTLKWKDVWSVWNTPVESRKNNAGLYLLLVLLILMLLLTALFLMLPVFARSDESIGASLALYFLALGLAFMMIETLLVQKSILFLGHPSYSFATVVCALLVGSGLGSRSTRKTQRENLTPAARRALLGAATAAALLACLLSSWLKAGLGWPLSLRILWLAAPILATGVLLGRLMPLGLARVNEKTIAWAWALNGSASVLGSIVAVVVAMQAGFSSVLWLAAGLYLIAGAVIKK
ncbi:MAG TPA: hypothetical protein VGK99_09210 [Acidobacteriota bacterium]|jgi:hypothetical protein